MKSFSKTAIQLDSNDNVAIAKEEIAPGTILQISNGDALTMCARVPTGHKFALHKIPSGDRVLRYGQPIGVATQTILPGDWVHTHNLAPGDLTTEYAYRVVDAPPPEPARQSFLGYRRADRFARIGTRNYIAVIATANCAAHTALQIARVFDRNRLANFPNVAGVVPIVHTGGCSNVIGSLAYRYLQRALANVARNPNLGAAIVVGLGCEENQAAACFDLTTLPGLVIREQGGFRKTIQAGVQAVEQTLPRVNALRHPMPALSREPRVPGDVSARVAATLAAIEYVGGKTARVKNKDALQNVLAELARAEQVKQAMLWENPELKDLGLAEMLTQMNVEIVSPRVDKHDLAQCDLGVTSADAVLPQTGTLVLRTTPEQAEVVSLLPRVHLAVFRPSALRADLTEIFAQVKDGKHTVLITGPSRTADIEKTLAIGVHGPKVFYAWSFEG
ncbi:MAG: UxaA family hydrolase [Anaerolineales bacterium]|nr:UxaA family hydrolase [Anaerolineales bacterium]